jgi:hypothetical protein
VAESRVFFSLAKNQEGSLREPPSWLLQTTSQRRVDLIILPRPARAPESAIVVLC